MTPLELYHHVGQLLEGMPAYIDLQPEREEHQVWQAKALAALESDGIASLRDASDFRHYLDQARGRFRSASAVRLRQALTNLLARLELRLPAEQRGAFISVGNDFSAFSTLASVIGEARNDLLVVDGLKGLGQTSPRGDLSDDSGMPCVVFQGCHLGFKQIETGNALGQRLHVERERPNQVVPGTVYKQPRIREVAGARDLELDGDRCIRGNLRASPTTTGQLPDRDQCGRALEVFINFAVVNDDLTGADVGAEASTFLDQLHATAQELHQLPGQRLGQVNHGSPATGCGSRRR